MCACERAYKAVGFLWSVAATCTLPMTAVTDERAEAAAVALLSTHCLGYCERKMEAEAENKMLRYNCVTVQEKLNFPEQAFLNHFVKSVSMSDFFFFTLPLYRISILKLSASQLSSARISQCCESRQAASLCRCQRSSGGWIRPRRCDRNQN